MNNKVDILQAVNDLPEFEYRDVGLKIPLPPAAGDAGAESLGKPETAYEAVPNHWTAITEIGSNDPITFASNRYKLVQFKESFIPLIETHVAVNGRLAYNQGFAVLDLFPDTTDNVMANGFKVGLSAYNSVDRTSALIIRFSVTDGTRVIAFPKNVASFYQAHIGQAKEKQDTYVEMIGKIKEFWPTVIDDMSKTDVTADLFDTVTKEFKCDPRIKKELSTAVSAGTKYNLWELIIEIYDKMGSKHSKSDIHLRKRRDEFIDSVMNWAVMLKLMA